MAIDLQFMLDTLPTTQFIKQMKDAWKPRGPSAAYNLTYLGHSCKSIFWLLILNNFSLHFFCSAWLVLEEVQASQLGEECGGCLFGFLDSLGWRTFEQRSRQQQHFHVPHSYHRRASYYSKELSMRHIVVVNLNLPVAMPRWIRKFSFGH